MSTPGQDEPITDSDIYGANDTARPPAPPVDHPSAPVPLSDSPYYLPNLVAAMVASVGVVVGSVGPWATVAELLTKNGAWLHGTITLVLGAVAGIASFTLLNRARAGVSPRSLLVLAWVAPIAGLICLVIAAIDIHYVATAGEMVQIGWGLWMVTICSAALGITAAVVAMQVGKRSEGSEAWTRTVITIAALVVLGGVVYFTTRPTVVYTQSTPSSPPVNETVTNTQTVTSASPVPVPFVIGPPADSTPCPLVYGPMDGYADSAAGVPPPGSPATTCQFAEEVRKAYAESGPMGAARPVTARSPVTGLDYTMSCVPAGKLVTCTGGNNAVVYIY